MKAVYFAIISLIVLTSCGDNSSSKNKYKQESLGNINTLQIVTTNELWNDSVGEVIRERFAAPTPGLPQDEPLFSMNQMPPDTYSGFARKYRLFIKATIGDTDTIAIRKNPYAKPQVGAFITATTPEGLVKLIRDNSDRIIKAFKNSEIVERQRRTKISKMRLDSLPADFGLRLEIPSAYRMYKSTKNFYWMQKDLEAGSTNIIVYEVPLSAIKEDSTAIASIIAVRDLVGEREMPVEDDGVFMTEEAYAPYIFDSEIDGHFAYETKGTWEVKGRFMAGPFVNYAIKDEKNDRWLILEGFTHAPSVRKRDLQFELESILKSAKLK